MITGFSLCIAGFKLAGGKAVTDKGDGAEDGGVADADREAVQRLLVFCEEIVVPIHIFTLHSS